MSNVPAGGGDGWQTTVVPGCFPTQSGWNSPPISMLRSFAAGVATTAEGAHLQVFAARREDNAIGQAFGNLADGWGTWVCSGYVPGAKRLVASNLNNGMQQVFATTLDGKLFWQQEFIGGWSSYDPFNLPDVTSFVTDLAVSTAVGAHDYVYVIDRGKIFVRYRMTDLAYAPYGTWHDLGAGPGGSVLTAGVLPGGKQAVFALDPSGIPYELEQHEATLGASFGAWRPAGSTPVSGLVDVEYGRANDGTSLLVALPATGNVLTSAADSEGTFGPWQAWSGPEFAGSGAAIAMTRQPAPNNHALLIVTTLDGRIQGSEATADQWGSWVSFL
ncbi:MAG: hypothetical protein ABI548_16765 [Polyangiaceae bacterium]